MKKKVIILAGLVLAALVIGGSSTMGRVLDSTWSIDGDHRVFRKADGFTIYRIEGKEYIATFTPTANGGDSWHVQNLIPITK